MELRVYINMLLRSWWIIALTTLLGFVAALYISINLEPTYQASTQLLVTPNRSLLDRGRDEAYAQEALYRRTTISTYAEILSSDRLTEEVAIVLGVDTDTLDDYDASTVVLPEANVLQVTVTGRNPAMVANYANALSQVGMNFIQSVDGIYTVEFIDTANPPSNPISPQPARNAALAAALGLLLGCGLGILRESMSIELDSLRVQNQIDPVSSAMTERAFLRELNAVIDKMEGDQIVSVGIVEFDSLAELRDVLPTSVYKLILRTIVTRMRLWLRGCDRIARWSETEFAIMLPMQDRESAKQTMTFIQAAFQKPLVLPDNGDLVDLQPRLAIATNKQYETSVAIMQRLERVVRHMKNFDDKNDDAEEVNPSKDMTVAS